MYNKPQNYMVQCFQQTPKNSELRRALTGIFVLCYWDVQRQVNEGRLPMLEADLDWLDLLGVGREGGGSSVYLNST